MNVSFEGKVVVVTGGTRGIGLAIANSFAKLGATVYATYLRSEETARKIESEATKNGFKLTMKRVDGTDAEACETFIKDILAQSGTVDILVNNAGITNDKIVLQMEKEDFTSVITANLSGSFNFIHSILPTMVRKRKGSIINISSIIATRPGKGQVNYSASKGAIESMTRALAQEVGSRNIRVNAIAPGIIETDMSKEIREIAGDEIIARTALKRMGTPEDVANLVLFLASDLSSYVTGQIWHVDGGM